MGSKSKVYHYWFSNWEKHKDMNCINFKKWLIENLIPGLPENSVFIPGLPN